MNLIHKEFLIALANGEEVEVMIDGCTDQIGWNPVDKWDNLNDFCNTEANFRVVSEKLNAPQMLLLLPTPFLPEIGEKYWFYSPVYSKEGYESQINVGTRVDAALIKRGVYRTEDEAIQALAAHEAAIAKLLEGAK